MLSTSIIFSILLFLAFSIRPAFSFERNRGQLLMRNNYAFPLYIEGVIRDTYLSTIIQPNCLISQLFRLTVNGTGNSLKITTRQGSRDIS